VYLIQNRFFPVWTFKYFCFFYYFINYPVSAVSLLSPVSPVSPLYEAVLEFLEQEEIFQFLDFTFHKNGEKIILPSSDL